MHRDDFESQRTILSLPRCQCRQVVLADVAGKGPEVNEARRAQKALPRRFTVYPFGCACKRWKLSATAKWHD